jgi:hypothetical protein
MISRLKWQAKTYYNAQAELAYVDSVFENLANANAPVAFDNDHWMAIAKKLQAKMSAATEEIKKLGGTINEGYVYDAQGHHIPSHILLAA